MKRILFITAVLPWPLRRNGGGQRTAVIAEALKAFGQVDIVGIGGPELTSESKPEALASHNVIKVFDSGVRTRRDKPAWAIGPLASIQFAYEQFTAGYRIDPEIAGWLDQHLKLTRYDLVVGRYLHATLRSGITKHNIPIVLDFDDIDWQAFDAAIRAKPWRGINGKLGAYLVSRRLRKIGWESLNAFSSVWVTCDEDIPLLPNCDATVLPNIPKFPENSPSAISPENFDVLFVGDLEHIPNREGLERFLQSVWPGVRKRLPTAQLKIVGRGMSQSNRDAWSMVAGVHPIGFAESIDQMYRDCAISVVPVYSGGGTKIKVLEALAHGRCPVVSEHAARGYQSLIESIAVRDSDAWFADAIVDLLKNKTLRDTKAAAGQAKVHELFSPERVRKVIERTFARMRA